MTKTQKKLGNLKDVIIVTLRVVFDVGTDLSKASANAEAFRITKAAGGVIEEAKVTLGKRDAG
jgi:hypothetical protein